MRTGNNYSGARWLFSQSRKSRRVHFVLYEPPVCGWTACNRVVGGSGVSYGCVTTDAAKVTCRVCQDKIPALTGPAPRRLPPSNEVPF